jgi:hypothetical protein
MPQCTPTQQRDNKGKKTKAYAGTAEAIPGSDTYLSCEILGF